MNNNYDEFISDEEHSYNEWVKDNLKYISLHKECVNIMKKLYIDGFAAGYVYHGKTKVAEQLQK
jgi:hypothetical protein